MSEKIVKETLQGLGLTEKDIETYIQIAKSGLTTARDITKSIKITKAQVYRSLKNLQAKSIVEATIETPQKFTAKPFEKVFDLYIQIKKDEAQKIEQNREAAVKQWQAIAKNQELPTQDKFMVIVGRNYIYAKVSEMLKKAKKEALISASSQNLVEADLENSLNIFIPNNQIPIRILTEISESNMEYMLEIFKQFSSNVQERHIDESKKFFPRFVLIDDAELLFVTQGLESSISQTDAGLWTNNKALILSFKTFFDQMWQEAVDIKNRIQHIKNRHEPPKNIIIKNPKEAYKTASTIIKNAKKEIIAIITENDVPFLLSSAKLFESLKKKNIDIKILAPITNNNRKFFNDISKFVKIRNSQASYFRSAIIDAEHLIQVKTTKEPLDSKSILRILESTLYTNDPEFVKGRRAMLLSLWENAPEEIEKLKRNLTKFRSMFENSNDAIILTTPKMKIKTANQAACKMFHITQPEIEKANLKKNFLDQQAIDTIKKLENNKQPKTELTYRRKDQTTFQGETTINTYTDTDGKTNLFLTIRDTTERKQREDTLKQSQTKTQTIINQLNIGVSIADRNGKLVSSNPAFRQIMGYNQEELETKTFLELTHPEDRPQMKKTFQDLLQRKTDKATVQKRNISKDDKIIPVRLNISILTRDKSGKPLEFIATTEETIAHANWAENKNQEQFNTILKNSQDLIYRLNLQTGHYEFISPAAKTILGFEPQEIANMNNEEVLATVHPEDLPKVQADLMKLVNEGKTVAEYRIKRKDGTYIWYRNVMFLTYDDNGRPLYRDGYCRDITQTKQ